MEKICRVCIKADALGDFTEIQTTNEIALKLNLIGGIEVCE